MTFNAPIHKKILVTILKAVAEDTHLGTQLGFKGGTAAYLIYGLPRDSVDLDFDLLRPENAADVRIRMQELLSLHGTLLDNTMNGNGIYFRLSYADKIPGTRNIEVDINLRKFGSTYEPISYLGFVVNVMVQADMAAHKLVAMLNRLGNANRDIFDVWFFLSENWPVNKKIIEERTEMTYKEFLEKSISALEAMNEAKILDGMGELLTESKKSWVKAKLRTETIFQLRILLEGEK